MTVSPVSHTRAHSRGRLALLVVVGVFLLAMAWTGVTQGLNQFPQSKTAGQTAQTLTQFGFGAFAFLSLVTTFWGRRWNLLMLGGWTVSVTLAAGLAAVVWGGTSLLMGVVTGAASFVVGFATAWLLRVGARGTELAGQ
jgi:hypothetical protein